ncbi:MAG: hypothetical protein FJ276_16760 [Planctomycetes bacterium]|nr:hypothetical protein [Planctomycetota bacterium]
MKVDSAYSKPDGAAVKVAAPSALPRERDRTIGQDDAATAAAQLARQRRIVRSSGYAVAAAKDVSAASSKLGPSAGAHGTEWGSVIHEPLENAMRDAHGN